MCRAPQRALTRVLPIAQSSLVLTRGGAVMRHEFGLGLDQLGKVLTQPYEMQEPTQKDRARPFEASTTHNP